jgi:hypothetical protein
LEQPADAVCELLLVVRSGTDGEPAAASVTLSASRTLGAIDDDTVEIAYKRHRR